MSRADGTEDSWSVEGNPYPIHTITIVNISNFVHQDGTHEFRTFVVFISNADGESTNILNDFSMIDEASLFHAKQEELLLPRKAFLVEESVWPRRNVVER